MQNNEYDDGSIIDIDDEETKKIRDFQEWKYTPGEDTWSVYMNNSNKDKENKDH